MKLIKISLIKRKKEYWNKNKEKINEKTKNRISKRKKKKKQINFKTKINNYFL